MLTDALLDRFVSMPGTSPERGIAGGEAMIADNDQRVRATLQTGHPSDETTLDVVPD